MGCCFHILSMHTWEKMKSMRGSSRLASLDWRVVCPFIIKFSTMMKSRPLPSLSPYTQRGKARRLLPDGSLSQQLAFRFSSMLIAQRIWWSIPSNLPLKKLGAKLRFILLHSGRV